MEDTTASGDSGRLVGRDVEVADAVEVLTGVSGGYVAVVGPAGIGKSSLVGEVARRANAAGSAVRTTSGAVSEADLPFLALHDLIGDDLATDGADLPPILGDALDAALLRRGPADAGIDPLALDLAVLRVLEHTSAERRVLLVLDDLPWVDAASRAILAFVLRRVPPARISVLVTMRPDAGAVDIVPPGAVRTVALGPLDPGALTVAVELHTAAKVPHRLVRDLYGSSGGNPLLAIELVHATTLDHDTLSGLTVPERYRTILSPRLAMLGPDARRALLAAALLSRPTLEEVTAVAAVDGILEAEVAGVVRVEDGGRVVFTHPLFAALCRDGVESSERRDMHALLAKAAADEIERARHLGRAVLLPDEDVAAEVEAAADQAHRRAAVAAAAELWLLAERLTPADDPDRRTTRGCAAAELFNQTGDVETAAEVVRRLLSDLEPGPLRARALVTLAQVVGEDSEASAQLLEEALRQPGLSEPADDEIRLARAHMSFTLGEMTALRIAAAALEQRAEATGRDELARRCRGELAFAEVICGTPPAASRAWRRMVQEASTYPLDENHPDLLRAWEAMSREDNERALHLLDGLMTRARQEGNIGLWACFAVHRNEIELRRGRLAAAGDLIDRAHTILSDGRHDEGWLYYRAMTAAWQGRLDEARADAAESVRMSQRDHNRLFEVAARHALGFIELSAARPEVAVGHYEKVAAGWEAMGWQHPSLAVWHGNAVESLIGTGRRDDATALTEQLAELAERYDLQTSRALTLRCRGLLLEDAGELDRAAAALDRSVRLSEPLDNPLEHARTLLVRGVVHRRRRQKALSREDLRRAHDLFAGCGAAVWAARADRELERSSAVAAGAGLTNGERAVAELAVSGATNREIAASLYLSEKTVEAVLTRVYRKLAVRSRTELGQHPDLVAAKGRT